MTTYPPTFDWLLQADIYAPVSPNDSTPSQQTILAAKSCYGYDEIDGYLAKKLWLRAAQIIEQEGEALLRQGLADVVQRWIELLPIPFVEKHPQLLYLLGACAWQQNQFYLAQTLLERALRGFTLSGDTIRQGKTLVNLATCAMILGDVAHSQALAGQALACSISPWQRVQLRMSWAWFQLGQGNWAPAKANFDEAILIAQSSNDKAALYSLISKLTPALTVLPGGLAKIEQICRQAGANLPKPDPFEQRLIDWNLAYSYWLRGQPEQALQLAQSVLQTSNGYLEGSLPAEIDLLTLTAVIQTTRGNDNQATDHFLRLLHRLKLVDKDQAEALWVRSLYLLGRKHWLQGSLHQVRQVSKQLALAQDAAELSLTAVLRPAMRGLLALADQHYPAAEQDFRQAVAAEAKVRLSKLVCNPRLWLAHLYLTWKRPEQALTELHPALVEGERNNTPGLILQEGPVMIPLLRLAAQRGVCASFADRLLKLLNAA